MSETRTDQSRSLFSNFREDLLASIVVFLVALPLCIGIAVAVGTDPARALITGIIGGLIVGFFAGSPLQVSGPAAGLFVIVADLIGKGEKSFAAKVAEMALTADEKAVSSWAESVGNDKGYSLMVLGTSVFLAGILQIFAGKLRLGQWFRAVSPAVIKGMLSGIGVLIVASQFHVMLDHEAKWNGHKAHGGLQYLATIPEAVKKCFYDDDNETTDHNIAHDKAGADDPESNSSEKAETGLEQQENGEAARAVESTKSRNHHLAALTGLITIIVIIGWPMIAPEKLKILPAALIAILAAALFASLAGLEVQKLEVPKNMFKNTTLPITTTWFQLLFDPIVITGAIVIGLVASAETLLCATAVDQMHSGPRTDYDRELSAQGIGNLLCGLVGALPMTGVIVRSSANVNSGAKTRLSSILHGVWLLLFLVALPTLLNYIPRAALGALLVHIGIKLVNLKQIKELWKMSRSEVLIYTVTLLVIVCEDLLIGVIVGILLSAAKLLYRFSHLELQVKTEGDVTKLDMEGAATFLRLPLLAAKLEQVPSSAELHVDFQNLSYIDHACLDLLMNWAKQHEATGGKLVIDWSSLHGRFTNGPQTNS